MYLAEIPVLAGPGGAGGIAPPTSRKISTRLKRVHEHSSPVNLVWCAQAEGAPDNETAAANAAQLSAWMDRELYTPNSVGPHLLCRSVRFARCSRACENVLYASL